MGFLPPSQGKYKFHRRHSQPALLTLQVQPFIFLPHSPVKIQISSQVLLACTSYASSAIFIFLSQSLGRKQISSQAFFSLCLRFNCSYSFSCRILRAKYEFHHRHYYACPCTSSAFTPFSSINVLILQFHLKRFCLYICLFKCICSFFR